MVIFNVFVFSFIFQAMLCSMWDLSSLTRARNFAPRIGSVESYSLDYQGSCCFLTFKLEL